MLTMISGFLDGLGQLLVLFHTDPYREKKLSAHSRKHNNKNIQLLLRDYKELGLQSCFT